MTGMRMAGHHGLMCWKTGAYSRDPLLFIQAPPTLTLTTMAMVRSEPAVYPYNRWKKAAKAMKFTIVNAFGCGGGEYLPIPS